MNQKNDSPIGGFRRYARCVHAIRSVIRRPRMSWALAALACVLTVVVSPRAAHASCGLDECPLIPPGPQTPAGAAERPAIVVVPPMFRYTSFSFTEMDMDGSYVEAIVRAEYRGLRQFVFAASVPLTVLMMNGETATGLGNAVALAEWTHRNQGISMDTMFGVGAQLEIPVGDVDSGIASNHFEVLPYVRATALIGQWFGFAQLGARLSLDGGHSHGHGGAAMVVNPHSDRELTYRAGGGMSLGRSGSTVSAFIDGQRVIDDHDADTTSFVNVGIETSWQVHRQVSIRTLGALPVTTPGRYDWRAGMGVNVRF